MTRATKRLRQGGVAGLAALATVGGMVMVTAGTAGATSTATSTRVSGDLRWDTAAAIAEKAFPSGADTVILASGATGHFADALAANYLAGQNSAPILLTDGSDTVPAATLTALTTLKAKNVILVGGTSAISAAQETALKATYTVTRLQGATRYDTNKAIVDQPSLTAGTINGVKTAIITSGAGFADALAAGPLAYANKLPVITTTPDALTDQAKAALTDLGIKQVIIVGGTAAVSAATEAAINALGVTTLTRAAGTDRSNTSQLLAEWELANAGFSNTSFIVASGDQTLGGVDALAGGPLGGTTKNAILVTNTVSAAGGGVTAFAGAHAGTVTGYTVLGGASAVSDAALVPVTAAVQGATTQAYAVSPNTAQAVTVSSGTPSDNKGVIQYTASGLGTSKVDLALFASGNVKLASGKATFTTSGGVAQQGTVVGGFAVVNGVGASGTTVNGVTPVNGSVTFTIDSTATGSVYPVVFQQPSSGNALATDASGNPTVSYGVGGQATWSAVGAPTGSYTTYTVDSVNATAGTLQAHNGGTAYTFAYNVAGSTYVSNSIPLSAAQFASYISAGDVVSVNYNAAGPSAWTLTTDVPGAPTGVTAAYSTTSPAGVHVSWTAPGNPSVTGYTVLRATVTNGVVGTYGSVGTTTTATTFTDTTGTAGTTYSYEVTSHNSTPTDSPASAAVTATVPASVFGALASAPISLSATITDGDVNNLVSANDVITITFNEPLATPAAGAAIALRDSDGTTGSLVNGTNATFTTGGTNNSVLTVKVTGAPTISVPGSTAGLAYSTLTVQATGTSGVSDTSSPAQAWDVAHSAAVVPNSTAPTAPTLTGTVTATGVTATAATVAEPAGSAIPGATIVVTDTQAGATGSGTAVAAADGSFSVSVTGTGMATSDTITITQQVLQGGIISATQSDTLS